MKYTMVGAAVLMSGVVGLRAALPGWGGDQEILDRLTDLETSSEAIKISSDAARDQAREAAEFGAETRKRLTSLSREYLPNEVAPNLVPVGTIMAFAGDQVPAGWAACNGDVIDTRQPENERFRALLDVIGNRWAKRGKSSKPGFLPLPDLTGRVPLGATDLKSAGSLGGSNSLQLSKSQLPAHDHGVGSLSIPSGGAHSHALHSSAAGASQDPGRPRALFEGYESNYNLSGGAHSHSLRGSTAESGRGASVDITPRHAVVVFIIKL